MRRAASGDEAWGTQGRVGKLAVGKRRFALPMRQAERRDERFGGAHRQDRRGGTAVRVCVAATAVSAAGASGIALIGSGGHVGRRVIVMGGPGMIPGMIQIPGMIHVLMGEGMRLGELRRVQDRHLGAAQHGHGKQSGNDDILDDVAHASTKDRRPGYVKTTAGRQKIGSRHETVKDRLPC
jgi:hypothetical protein